MIKTYLMLTVVGVLLAAGCTALLEATRQAEDVGDVYLGVNDPEWQATKNRVRELEDKPTLTAAERDELLVLLQDWKAGRQERMAAGTRAVATGTTPPEAPPGTPPWLYFVTHLFTLVTGYTGHIVKRANDKRIINKAVVVAETVRIKNGAPTASGL